MCPNWIKNPATGLVLDVAGGVAAAGTIVWSQPKNESGAQLWEILPNGVIQSVLGDFALDLQDLPTTPFVKQVVINPINNSLTQQWDLAANGVINSKKKYNIIGLDFTFSLASETIILAYPIDVANPKPNQKWELVKWQIPNWENMLKNMAIANQIDRDRERGLEEQYEALRRFAEITPKEL